MERPENQTFFLLASPIEVAFTLRVLHRISIPMSEAEAFITTDSKAQPRQPEPSLNIMEGLNPPQPWIPVVIVLILVFIVAFSYILLRRRKSS